MKDSILFSFTNPYSDWLFGIEFIPEAGMPDIDGQVTFSMLSIGIFFFRIDFLNINK